ncbi:monooxygenase [Corallincola spongiicola]|uniref:Monooxygenase n=1 Tax=Corallincola spongiicola TaxID=2520508 RepID=A0ABY1WTH7_9GAMM|nr:monooxygenase [Corallincola spongiicola]TAA48040.1 monooxygenase [Corallincola spongiicola]
MTDVILEIHFHSRGPWHQQLEDACRGLAEEIAQAPGLKWKIWTENRDTRLAGGIYLFANEADAEDFLLTHRKRLEALGVTEFESHLYEVNEQLSLITRAPL